MPMEDNKPRSAVLREALEQGKRRELPMRELLSVKEVTYQLNISRWTLRKLRKSKQLKSLKIGNRRLFRMRSIQDYLDRREAEEAM